MRNSLRWRLMTMRGGGGVNVSLQEIKEEVLQLAESFGWDEDGSRSTPTSSSSS
jgi:KaiC/GvpD/RAD55 family RecA-like ATPase